MSRSNPMNPQTGVALLSCLIFLTALTLLGLSAAADTVLQNQLVSNFQESERAKQAAMSALTGAENWLMELDGPIPGDCQKPCDGLYVHAPGELPAHPEFESISWWQENGYEAGMDPLADGSDEETITSDGAKPIWLIQELHSTSLNGNGPKDTQGWYRILARAKGPTEAVVSVVESIVVRSWSSGENPAAADANPAEVCPPGQAGTDCGRVSWRELR